MLQPNQNRRSRRNRLSPHPLKPMIRFVCLLFQLSAYFFVIPVQSYQNYCLQLHLFLLLVRVFVLRYRQFVIQAKLSRNPQINHHFFVQAIFHQHFCQNFQGQSFAPSVRSFASN